MKYDFADMDEEEVLQWHKDHGMANCPDAIELALQRSRQYAGKRKVWKIIKIVFFCIVGLRFLLAISH